MTDARIVIMSQDQQTGEDLREKLTGMGFETPVSVVSNPEEVSASLDSHESLFLIIEVAQGESSDWLAHILQRTERPGVGVIAITKGCDIGFIESAMGLNPHGILVKPFSDEQLAATMHTALNQLGVAGTPELDALTSDEIAPSLDPEQSEESAPAGETDGIGESPDDMALEDIVPICSGYKQVREHDGCWTQIEYYLRSRYNLWFTHTLCPECVTIYLNWTTELAQDHEHGTRREGCRCR